MPLRTWRCGECGEEFTTKASNPTHCGDVAAELVLSAPSTKFLEKIDEERGKSRMVDQEKILRERARRYSRQHEMHDLIQMNPREQATQNQWIKEDGSVRKAIDDK